MANKQCELCADDVTRIISAPADTGPVADTDAADDFSFAPAHRWNMPLCTRHFDELRTIVGCASCHRPLPRVDAIVNSSGTVHLCRPCNLLEG